ncbi:Transmembrane protein 43 [Mactra antiquata]
MEGRTRVSYEGNPGYLKRVGSSLSGVLVGIVLLFVASGVLFWNEGRAVQTAKSLDEGLSMVVPLKSPNVISLDNEGKLVHFIGNVQTSKVLSDPEYNIAVQAVKLKRIVEMYQWIEHERERKYDEGNGKTRVEKEYTYSQEWRTDVVKSTGYDDAFNHRNPSSMSVAAKSLVADQVDVGQFSLSDGLVSKISNFKQLPIDHRYKPGRTDVQMFDGYIYHSKNPIQPETGDIRIKFEYAGISGQSSLGPQMTVTIVARQINGKVLPYQTVAGDQLEILYEGKLSPKEVFGREKAQNTLLTWGIRLAGWLVMFVGFSCLTKIIATLVDWVPIVRDLVAAGVTLMNVSLAISWSLTVIAFGWIYYRPLLGIGILAMAMTPFVMSRWSRGSTSRRVD